jgi:hypothetical protein
MNFDAANNPINWAFWADRYKFISSTAPLTRNTAWTWNTPNTTARFNSLIASQFEMGLFEPTPYASSAIRDGYSEARSKTSATYNSGHGCPSQAQKLPCDYEWPYQSSQYELPYNNPLGTTTSEKIAWGSSALYGTSVPAVYDGTQSVPFVGFPANKLIEYKVCLVLGVRISGGLTSAIAAQPANNYKCATKV